MKYNTESEIIEVGTVTGLSLRQAGRVMEHFRFEKTASAAEDYLMNGRPVEALRTLDDNRVPAEYRKKVAMNVAEQKAYQEFSRQESQNMKLMDDPVVSQGIDARIRDDLYRAYCSMLRVDNMERRM